MKYVIDRFEENWAIIESIENPDDVQEIPRAELKGIAPGTTIYKENDKWLPDYENTQQRKKEIQSKFDRIKKANGYL
ncbi:MAG: DUF3006 domain-containing protein [Defluviitaleaceae bacterium]|nr:DUF3006 domain-containing protein [Defluviitaleaceae bacterium]